MKNNTLKLLTWLYPRTVLTYAQLELLLPDLTPGGRRSLVHHLVKKHLLRVERTDQSAMINLTSHGRAALEADLAVFDRRLDSFSGEWSALVFLASPAGDPQFRYLRKLLLRQHAFDLRRGVYLFPGEFPSQILNTCQELYVGAVVILKFKDWVFGDEKAVISQNYAPTDLMEIYSGISKEVNQLLMDDKYKKGLTVKSQRQIFSVFDRLFEILSQDPGFLKHFYPQFPDGRELLALLQSLIKPSS